MWSMGERAGLQVFPCKSGKPSAMCQPKLQIDIKSKLVSWEIPAVGPWPCMGGSNLCQAQIKKHIPPFLNSAVISINASGN